MLASFDDSLALLAARILFFQSHYLLGPGMFWMACYFYKIVGCLSLLLKPLVYIWLSIFFGDMLYIWYAHLCIYGCGVFIFSFIYDWWWILILKLRHKALDMLLWRSFIGVSICSFFMNLLLPVYTKCDCVEEWILLRLQFLPSPYV